MPTYRITIRREVEQFHDFEIEADTKDEAHDQANDEIENISDADDWTDGNTTADAEITEVTELTDKEGEDEDEEDAEDKDEDEDEEEPK
jgi:hypothetical protein